VQVNQLLRFTAWGELDYLIIDMPPGTGDIQITLSQQFAIDAALIVSTPQKLSFIDVVKGIDMFDKVNIPTVGVVENMAYFKCGSCDAKHYPFGSGYRRQVSDLFGIKNSFELPLDAAVARQSDAGDPLVLDHSPKTAEVRAVYSSIADAVHTELVALKSRKQSEPVFGFDEKQKMVTVQV
jgi:MinD-like ATPase involved in chromosome partitioning or flagellar assembly